MSFTIGENVGVYRITDQLGQGGMATVYRAYHANLDRYVAIKVLHAAFKSDESFITRFRREAQIVAKLEHPGIIPIYDYNEHHGEPYLVMKFIEGETLKARLSREPLTLDEALKFMTAVGQALTYAHERGILHRDIKPSNILLEKGTDPYIADFGLARMASLGESTLSRDLMLGTPQYMSPEQAQGVKDLDAGTDIYSLGVVLYELVVGRVPFNADTPYAIVHDHIYAPLPLPSRVNPQVTRSVERVLLKALAKDRADRYTSAVEMVNGFREAIREDDVQELSAGRYRVPMPSEALRTPEFAAAISAPAGIPAPMPSYYPPSVPPVSSTAQRYERQRRRKSLWMLGGFAGLIATCLTGMFVTVSAFGDANIRSSLFVPRPTVQTTATAVALAASATSAETVTPAPGVTIEATLEQTATDAPTPQGTLRPAGTFAAILAMDDPNKYVADNPGDPLGHFALAQSLFKDGKIVRAQQEVAEGVRLAKNNPALLIAVAQQMARSGDPTNGVPAVLYTYAYGKGVAGNAQIRDQIGQNLYKFAQSARRKDMPFVKIMGDIALDTKSAGLYAFLALAYNSLNQPAAAKDSMDSALALDATLAEVHLVHGILYAGQNDPDHARVEFGSASAAPDAPAWVVSEARAQLQKGT